MTQLGKPEIWIILDRYLPGYKGGGPIQSIANLVDELGDDFDFRIVTRDRDLGAAVPYPGLPADGWIPVGKALVRYLPAGYRSVLELFQLLRRAKPRVVYLNSLFSRPFTLFPILLRRLSLVDIGRILLAPRGELGNGALQIKRWRKMLFIKVARLAGFYRGVLWQASTRHEKEDIGRNFFETEVARGEPIPVWTARNLGRRVTDLTSISDRRTKPSGQLRLVFLSRISRKKNLCGALKMLPALKGQVLFTIYGPIEDPGYWEECQAAIATLPANLRVEYAGELDDDLKNDALRQHDVFFLPTLNENFCHAILEALQAGCPVITSDQTAWRDLETAGVGWDIPLDDVDRFQRALQQCIDMTPSDFLDKSRRAFQYAMKAACGSDLVQKNRALLLAVTDASVLEQLQGAVSYE